MKQQPQCLFLLISYILLSYVNGQTFPSFGQPTQGQRNPSPFLQRQVATGTADGTGGTRGLQTGFGTQRTIPGQIGTVTVPVLPAPSAGFGQSGTLTSLQQTGTLSGIAGGQGTIPVPRFAPGTGTIGRPFVQFTQGTGQQGSGMPNAAMMAARQRQLALMRQNAQLQQRQQAFARRNSPFTRMGLATQAQMANQMNAGAFPPFMGGQQNGFMSSAGLFQRQPQQQTTGQAQQQALARIRAAGGLPPFAFMNRPTIPSGQSPFGMFPGGTSRTQANRTTAGRLWQPNVRMQGMMAPSRPQGFAAGGQRFTGASNALNPQAAARMPVNPIVNPRDPRIGLMPPLGGLNAFGSQQRPFPRQSGRATQNQINQINAVRPNVRRAETNNITPLFPSANSVIPRARGAQQSFRGAFPGAINNGIGGAPQGIAAFPGSGRGPVVAANMPAFPGESNNAVDFSGAGNPDLRSVPNVAAFPGAGRNKIESAPNAVAFPGSETPIVESVSNVAAFPGGEPKALESLPSVAALPEVNEVSAFPGTETRRTATNEVIPAEVLPSPGAFDNTVSKPVVIETIADVPAFPGGETITDPGPNSPETPIFPVRRTPNSRSKPPGNSGPPVLFSLTVNGEEPPLRPGELPAPPPVIPARDIERIPSSADAVLFPSIDIDAISASQSGSSASGSQPFSSVSTTGIDSPFANSKPSTVDVSLVRSSTNGLNTIDATPTRQGNAVGTKTKTVPEFQGDSVSNFPSFPGVQKSKGIGGVPIRLFHSRLRLKKIDG